MPRLLGSSSPLVAEATPAQIEKGVADTIDLMKRARDICRQLELPISELRTVSAHLYNQIHLQIINAEDARQTRRHDAIEKLRRVESQNRPPIGHMAMAPNLGHYPMGVPMVQQVSNDELTRMDGTDVYELGDEALNERLKAAGLPTL